MSRFVTESRDEWRFASEPLMLDDVSTVEDLVEYLGVQDSSQAEQDAAIGQWLEANRPRQLLAAFLRSAGYDL